MKSLSFTKACFCVDWNCAVWLLFAAAVYWTTAAAIQQSSLIDLSLDTGLQRPFGYSVPWIQGVGTVSLAVSFVMILLTLWSPFEIFLNAL